MEDRQIIELYHARDEAAIGETDRKYGGLCRRIALNILSIWEDAEECVSDTYHAAWNSMPPESPNSLGAFLGRITRNISISRFRSLRAQKRFAGMEVLLSELDDCVPAPQDVGEAIELRELSEHISRWLDSLSADDRALFVRRYWYGDRLQALAKDCGYTASQLAQRMLRLRRGLRTLLESEGVTI